MQDRRDGGRFYTLSPYQGVGRGPSLSPFHTPGAHLIMFGIRCSPALLQAQSSLLRFMASIYFICQERASKRAENPNRTLGTNSDVFVLRYRTPIDRGGKCKKIQQH